MKTFNRTQAKYLKNKARNEQPRNVVLQKFFLDRAKQIGKGSFWRVTQDLPVFKKVEHYNPYRSGIVNLIIPKGAIIRVPFPSAIKGSKLRANVAYVHSVYSLDGEVIKAGYSRHNKNFIYRPEELVIPTTKYSMIDAACESGIHCFMDLYSAITYN